MVLLGCFYYIGSFQPGTCDLQVILRVILRPELVLRHV